MNNNRKTRNPASQTALHNSRCQWLTQPATADPLANNNTNPARRPVLQIAPAPTPAPNTLPMSLASSSDSQPQLLHDLSPQEYYGSTQTHPSSIRRNSAGHTRRLSRNSAITTTTPANAEKHNSIPQHQPNKQLTMNQKHFGTACATPRTHRRDGRGKHPPKKLVQVQRMRQ